MTEYEFQTSNPQEVVLSFHPDFTGRFWIEPEELRATTEVINTARLPLMSLGVESHRDVMPPLDDIFSDFLVDSEDHLYGEEKRALEVGYLYGSLLKSQEAKRVDVPPELARDIVQARDGLDLSDQADNYKLFMRIRDLEVAYAKSDILAFSLAATQDHMAALFEMYHEGDQSLEKQEITRLQSLYYAGALVGAYAHAPNQEARPTIEIMRGKKHDDSEPVSARIELEATDDVSSAVEYGLRSQYEFRPVRVDDVPAIAILPGGLQFGPNALSVPLYIPGISDLTSACFVPAKKVDALLVEMRSDDKEEPAKVRYVKDVRAYLRQSDIALNAGETEKIVGLVADDRCVSAYSSGHPDAPAIDALVQRYVKKKHDRVTYCSSDELKQVSLEGIRRRAGRSALIAFAACAWIPDIYGKLFVPDHKVEWMISGTLSLASLGALALRTRMHRRLDANERRSAQQFDGVVQEFVDMLPLQTQQDSGNISS